MIALNIFSYVQMRTLAGRRYQHCTSCRGFMFFAIQFTTHIVYVPSHSVNFERGTLTSPLTCETLCESVALRLHRSEAQLLNNYCTNRSIDML